MLNIPDWITDALLVEMKQILEKENMCVTHTTNTFMKLHPEIKIKRKMISNFIIMYKRENKIPFCKKEPISHKELLQSVKSKLENKGMRAIIIGQKNGKIPDIIGIRNGKIYQIEVETSERSTEYLEDKIDKQYDETVFFIGESRRKL